MYIHPKVRYKEPGAERKHSVVKYICSRVLRTNKNFLCAVTGQTGNGKSWACGSMAELYSKMSGVPFIPEKHTFFSLKQLLNIINNQKEHEVRIGTPLVYDESQVEANARNWQSLANKMLSTLVSTFRNQRLVLFFPTPVLEYLDKQSRILFHAEFQVLGYDLNTCTTKIRPRFLEYNKRIDDFYKKRLIVEYRQPDKRVYNKYYVQDWTIPKPSDSWINVYEPMKEKFTTDLNQELLRTISKEETAKKDKNEEFLEVYELYTQLGEDYVEIAKRIPTVSPYILDKYIQYIKRANKTH